MHSLQSRLGFWLAFFLIVFFGLDILLMGYFPRYLAEERVLTRLQHDADSLSTRLQFDLQKRLHLRGPISPIYSTPLSGHYFQAEAEQENSLLLSPSLDNTPLKVSSEQIEEVAILHLKDQNGIPLLGLGQKKMINGLPVRIVIAEEIEDIEEDIRTLKTIYFFGTMLSVLLVILLQRYILRREMRPVKWAKQELSMISKGEKKQITQRLPSEIQPLVDELNYLLGVMDKRLERSRNATGNLAHALKTPLSVLMQLVDSPEIQKQPEVVDELTRISSSIHVAIDRELKRARLAGAALPGQYFNLAEEIPELIAILKKVYASKNLDIVVDIPPQKTFQADREDMLEMFGNLLDNACKWAKYCVRITVLDKKGLSFIIEDDGRGIAGVSEKDFTERGTRLDETTPGHGLGLAIVQEIVTQYNGTIEFETSPQLGGLQVSVVF
jgi:signal transduction histidine kinase